MTFLRGGDGLGEGERESGDDVPDGPLIAALGAINSVNHLVVYLNVWRPEWVVGAMEQTLCPEHQVAVFQGGEAVVDPIHVELVEIHLG